jgi:hypothetical protein
MGHEAPNTGSMTPMVIMEVKQFFYHPKFIGKIRIYLLKSQENASFLYSSNDNF